MQADGQLRRHREMGSSSVNGEAKGEANDQVAPT